VVVLIRRAWPLLPLLVLTVALGACGGGSKHAATTSTTTTTTATVPDPGTAMAALIKQHAAVKGVVRTLYLTPAWAVVESVGPARATALAFRLENGTWVADRSGKVKLQILGPQAASTTTAKPAVALKFMTTSPSIESALWIDGSELVERGGGTPTRGTISGSPLHPLAPGSSRGGGLCAQPLARRSRRLGLQYDVMRNVSRRRAGRRRRRAARAA
jgi:hypothetical protein